MITTINYPALALLVEAIAADNGLICRRLSSWPQECEEMEKLARTLRSHIEDPGSYHDGPYESEIELMAMGEESDKKVLISKNPALRELDLFLNEAFDGKYCDNFFRKGVRR